MKGFWIILIILFSQGVAKLPDLFEAIKESDLKKIKEHINEENINVLEKKQNSTPLMFAAQHGELKTIEFLLKEGADPDIKNKDGKKALYLAHKNPDYGVFKTLLKKTRISIPNFMKDSLSYAHLVNSEDIDGLEYLIEKGLDFNEKNEAGEVGLTFAVKHGAEKMIRYFMINGADPNVLDKEGMSPFHWSVVFGNLDIVRYIIMRGVDVHLATKSNETSLMIAAKEGHEHIVSFLLGQFKFKDIRSSDGETALSLALKHGHKKIAGYLRKNDFTD